MIRSFANIKKRKIEKTLSFLFIVLFNNFLSASSPKDCELWIKQGIDYMAQKQHEKSLQILTKSRNIAKENHWYKQEFLAINNIGANYYMMLDYGEALNNYLDAYKIAIAHLDENAEMTVLNNIAILYSKEKKNDRAEEYFRKAYEIADKNKDKIKKGLYAINLAVLDNEKKQYREAENFLTEALVLTKDTPFFVLAQTTQVETLVNLKQFGKAKELAYKILPNLNTVEHSESKTQVYYNLSKIYEEENDLGNAFHFLDLASKENLSYEYKEIIFNRYSELFRKNKNIDKAFLYKDSIINVRDSLNKIKNGQLFENNRIKFELQNSQKNLTESREKLKTERYIFLFSILFALLLIGVFVWALRNSVLKNKQQKIIESRNHEIARLEQEKFKNEIESKNRKLAAKALQLSNKNEIIEQLITSLSQQSGLSENTSVNKTIHELKLYLKQNQEEEKFLSHFEEVNQGFILKLKELHPDLNSNDIRFLSYVYMNLSTKEIALLLNITFDACRKRKERIIRKMNKEDTIDLYSYITGI